MRAKSESNQINITRVYDAPVETVWDAWTDPEQVAQWWGPRGFTLTTHSKDLRAGGGWHYTMHGPDGVDYINKTRYLEVVPYSRLVYDHGGNDDRAALFRVTVEFTELEGQTRMEMTMTLPTAESAAETRKHIKNAGGDSTWDRLAEYLFHETSGLERFVINRSFNVSLNLMQQMWTDAEHFAQWLPPSGMTMKLIKSDIRSGGDAFFVMTDSHGAALYGRLAYLEVSPSGLIYTQQFCDENGKILRHPMVPTWPETMLTTVTFTEESDERTRVTVVWEPHGETTAEELDTFVLERGGMTKGWTGSFDKLEALLRQ